MAQTALYIKGLQNETWAKDEFVNRSQQLGKIESDFYAKKGANAVAAQDQYANDVRNLYEDAVNNAPNPQAKRFLGDALSRRISYSIVDGQRHAGEQGQQYMKTVSENRVAEAMSTAAQHPNNDVLFNDQLSVVRSEAQAQAEQNGEGKDGFNRRVEQYVSLTWEARLRAIGFNDPQRALKMLDDNADQIKGISPQGKSYVETIREHLQQRNNIIGADADAEKILGGDKLLRSLNSNFSTTISNAAERHGLDPTLLARQLNQESGLNPNVRDSRAGAQGIAQFIPETARRYNVDVRNPQSSIEGAAHYMEDLTRQFNGNTGLALAGYNWGENNVARWLASGANPNSMPAETRNYVKSITGQSVQDWVSGKRPEAPSLPRSVAAAGPDVLEKSIDEAYKVGAKYGPEYTQHLVAQVQNKYNQFHNAYRLQEFGTFANLSSVISGASGGAPITDRNTLLTDPVLYQQYESLGESAKGQVMQQRLLAMVDSNSKKGSLPSEAQGALVDRLRGMAVEAEQDPAVRDRYMNQDWGAIYSQVDQGRRNSLSSDQVRVQRAAQKPEQDPTHLSMVMRTLDPILLAHNIDKQAPDQRTQDKYLQFQGAVYQKLQEMVANGEQVPSNPVKLQELFVPLMRNIGLTSDLRAAAPTPSLPPTITSKVAYDALAPGSPFFGPDGKRYNKPSVQPAREPGQ